MTKIFTYARLMPFFLFAASFCANAQSTWTGAVNANWNTSGNWSPEGKPLATTDVIIPGNVTNYPLVTGGDGIADCANLTIQEGGSVIVNSEGSGRLRVYGTINVSGTLDISNGTLIMAGNLPQTIPADALVDNTVRNLTIYHVGTLGSTTIEGPLSLTGILDINGGILNTGGFLTLKSTDGATAMVAEVDGILAAINGDVTVERYISGKRAFRLISPSTTGGTINSNWQEGGSTGAGFGTHITGAGGAANGFDATTTNNASLFTHTNTDATWQAVTNTTTGTLTAGTPYRLLVRGDRTVNLASNTSAATPTVLRTTGTLATGNVVVTDFGPDGGDFSMVGNPYQAIVDMGAVLADANNLNTDFYYVWDPTLNTRGAYTTVTIALNTNTTPGSQANRYLQPNHAVFVQTDMSFLPTSLTFTEAHKFVFSNATPNLYREATDAPQPNIRLAMYPGENTEGTALDGLMIRFDDAYSNQTDNKDAVKPTNQDEGVGIMNSGKILSVESRQMPTAEDVLPLVNTTYRGTAYTYKINVNEIENVTAYLQDNYTGIATELPNNTETVYDFSVNPGIEASTAQNRFSIIFAESLGTGAIGSTGFSMYPNPASSGAFTIQLAAAENPSVAMYNQLGQKVACEVTTQGTVVNVAMPQAAAGIYMVQVINGGKTAVQKLIVK